MAAALLLFIGGTGIALSRQQARSHPKAWLGVSIRDVTESVAKENKLADESGAYVEQVENDSPADSAGIERGDIIREFGQKKIDDADGLVEAVGKMKVGEKVKLVYVHKGEQKSVDVTLGKSPRMRSLRPDIGRIIRGIRVFADRDAQGMQLMELNNQLSEYFGVPSGTGVLVERVRKGSAAEKAGVKAGDVLLKIGTRTIDDMEDVSKAFSKYDEGDKVEVEVSRKGVTKSLSLEVKEDSDSPSFDWHGFGDGGMYGRPPFEENHFGISPWNEHFQWFNPSVVHPDMKGMEEQLHNMEKSLKDQEGNFQRSFHAMRLQSI